MRLAPLGGCGEFGLHSTLIEADCGAVCVDAGLMFPSEDTPGVEYLVPSFAALSSSRLQGFFLTHGHEDHVGALGFALRVAPAPVWGTPMTLALARPRLEELHLAGRADLRPIAPGETVRLDGLAVSALAVRHSVPGALGFVVEAYGARALLTGDHKGLADAPPGDIDLMLGDSTGVLRPGRTPSEAEVAAALEATLASVPREHRVVVAMFASNVERVQTVMDLGARLGRTVGLLGRSLREAADAARALGLLRPPAGAWVEPARARLVIATGGQGESGAALARIAAGAHGELALRPGDAVLFSGRPVPGNERQVGRLQDELAGRGITVMDAPTLHASGHGSADDLAEVLRQVAPRCLIPVHGGARHLHAHVRLARELGVRSALVARNGDAFEITRTGVRPAGTVPTGHRCVEAGALLEPEVVAARRAAGHAGVVSIAGDSVTLSGIAGVDAAEVAELLRKEGVAAAIRFVRRRTGKRPHVIVHSL